MAFGMAMMFTVESPASIGKGPYGSLPPPPKDFPTCGLTASWGNVVASASLNAPPGPAANPWFWISIGAFIMLSASCGTIIYLMSKQRDREKYDFRALKEM
jgi:hypothetical protein